MLRRAALLAVVLVMTACATAPKPEKKEQAIAPETRAAYDKALTLLRADRYKASIEAFHEVTERNDALAGPYVNMGIAYRALHDDDNARDAFEKAIKRDPGSGAAYNQLGLLYRHAGEFAKARTAYETGLKAEPDYLHLYINLGILCDIYLQDPECALRNYREYQSRSDGNDDKIKRWIADVQRRVQ